jgi:glycosyltransferase involved in cell wall biosynthesis
LRKLQNECGLHLCPSRSEGWGHNLVEGLSCGALVLTTDAPPMNEHVRPEYGVLIPAGRSEPRHMGINHFVGIDRLETAIEAAIHMPEAEKIAKGELARQRFLDIDKGFRERVAELLAKQA